jgi:septal ring factor EnvC (AmiA/AmiB activator)
MSKTATAMDTPAAIAPIAEPIVITQYEVLLADIEEAKKTAIHSFEYETKQGNTAARSYVFSLRKLRARIESARKDAKAYALAYGKRVDEQAKDLSIQIDELIQPHQEQLEAIARREAERVQAHQRVLDQAIEVGHIHFGENSQQIQGRLDALDEISLDGLEEFADKVAAAIVASRRTLQQALQQALQAEEQARELARLQEEQRQRDEQERQARLEREAQERADALAAQAAADAIEAAERRAAEAEAKAAAAEAKAAAQEAARTPPAPAASPSSAVVPEPEPPAVKPAVELERPETEPDPRREWLKAELLRALDGRTRREVAERIVTGTLHYALRIDWEKIR